jgi:hypothetical protein
VNEKIMAALRLRCAVTFDLDKDGNVVCMIDLPAALGPGPVEFTAVTVTDALDGAMGLAIETGIEAVP